MVLADRDKVEMDDLIREKVRPTADPGGDPHAAPRSTSATWPWSGPQQARSIVVLSPEDDEEPDAQVIKTVLALTKGRGHRDRAVPHRRRDPGPGQPRARPRLVGGDEAVLIDKRETIAKLVVHSARQSGASVAFIELLDFKGDEIYFREDPGLAGRPFAEALLAYEDCSAIGLSSTPPGTVHAQPAGRARRSRAGEQAGRDRRRRHRTSAPPRPRRRRSTRRRSPTRRRAGARPSASSCSAGTTARRR